MPEEYPFPPFLTYFQLMDKIYDPNRIKFLEYLVSINKDFTAQIDFDLNGLIEESIVSDDTLIFKWLAVYYKSRFDPGTNHNHKAAYYTASLKSEWAQLAAQAPLSPQLGFFSSGSSKGTPAAINQDDLTQKIF